MFQCACRGKPIFLVSNSIEFGFDDVVAPNAMNVIRAPLYADAVASTDIQTDRRTKESNEAVRYFCS